MLSSRTTILGQLLQQYHICATADTLNTAIRRKTTRTHKQTPETSSTTQGAPHHLLHEADAGLKVQKLRRELLLTLPLPPILAVAGGIRRASSRYRAQDRPRWRTRSPAIRTWPL